MLANRLMEHAMSSADEPLMTDSQIRAAQILLNKVAPDLKAVEMTGEDGERLVPKKIELVVRHASEG